jgi:ubiquinone/menaquinone biosynthesis C-methylase UbiE
MSAIPVHLLDEIDWNEIWKAQQQRHEFSKHFNDPTHNWSQRENAERYDSSSHTLYDARVKTTIAGLLLTKKMTVLDIGAGPGTLAIPLSSLVKKVTMVEPAEGMVSILNDHIKKQGIKNISCIQKHWEEIEPITDLTGPYDVVIASLSLTMHDIRLALKKMDIVSSGTVYLFWFVDLPFWERMYVDLWQPLHGSAYYPGPKADCLFNVLYQMGIYANVEMLPLQKEYRFTTLEEMLVFFKRRFNVTTSEQEKILVDYITSNVKKSGHELILSGDSTFAKIWWNKKAT